jgi:hypothetical protein
MTRIISGVGDLVQRTGDGCTGQVLGGRIIERSGDAMCGVGAHKMSISCSSMSSKYMK